MKNSYTYKYGKINEKKKTPSQYGGGGTTQYLEAHGPVLDKSTIRRDIQILKKYGGDFQKFFDTSSSLSLPMFTEPPSPRSVKRILADKTLTTNAGADEVILFYPFWAGCPYMYSQDQVTSSLYVNETSMFHWYRVVAAKLTIREVAIDSNNPNLVSTLDAMIVPPGYPPSVVAGYFLNIMVAPGDRVVGANGREGIQVTLIGSPLFNKIYPDANTLVNPVFTLGKEDQYDPAYVPGMCPRFAIPISSMTPPDGRGPGGGENYMNMTSVNINPTYFTGFKNGACVYQDEECPTVAVRVNDVGARITLKVQLDMVVEGQLRVDHITDLPHVMPPCHYQFSAVERAIRNVCPRVMTTPDYIKYRPLTIILSDMGGQGMEKSKTESEEWEEEDDDYVIKGSAMTSHTPAGVGHH